MKLSKEEVLSIISTQPNGNIEEKQFKKKFPELYQEITSLSFPEEFKWTQKLYHFFHDDTYLKLGICPICGKRCKFQKFNLGYCKHCSYKCTQLDKETQIKIKETCIEKYDKEYYSQTNEWFEKTKETCQEKWSVSSYSQTNEWFEKTKETCIERYGKEHYTQTDEYKERYEKTCLERYGVPNFMQSPESTKYHRKRIEYDGSTFDSTWEVKIYQYCKENNISCEYQPNIIFEYEYEGKKHYYHPDFLINGKIYEVKGDQFFDENGKMINPYDKESDLFEAKHQCMLQNNVIILRGEDIKNLNINIFK